MKDTNLHWFRNVPQRHTALVPAFLFFASLDFYAMVKKFLGSWSGLSSCTIRYDYGLYDTDHTCCNTACYQITVKYGTVYGTVPCWHCQCIYGLRKVSPPQNLPFSLPSVLLPCADTTQCFPERPWGWVGAASAQGKGPAVACLETQSWTQYLISGY